MKHLMSILFLIGVGLVLSVPAQKPPVKKGYISVTVKDGNATSELLSMPMAFSPNLSMAEIAIKYFGPVSDSDISVLLILKGAQNRYSKGGSFGVKMFCDDIPLRNNRLRGVSKVDKNRDDETLHFYITPEELAWLVTGETARIELYDADSATKYDTVSFTKAGFSELKRFAKSVLLIRSQLD